MIQLTVVITCLVTRVLCYAVEEKVINPNFSYSIDTEKKAYAPCDAVYIDILLKNISDKVQDFYVNNTDSMTRINATFNKKPLLKTREANNDYYKYLFKITGQMVDPNQEIDLIHPASGLFDMTLAGKYTFQFERKMTDAPNESYVTSNTLVVEINEKLIVVPEFQGEKLWNDKRNELSIGIRTDQAVYKNLGNDQHGPVFLEIECVKNDDKISITELTENIFDTFELSLTLPGRSSDFRVMRDKYDDKEEAALTLYGQHLKATKSKQSPVFTTEKDKDKTVVLLNRIFDMSTSGIYGLSVKRKILDADGRQKIISSEILPIRLGESLTFQERTDLSEKEKK